MTAEVTQIHVMAPEPMKMHLMVPEVNIHLMVPEVKMHLMASDLNPAKMIPEQTQS